MENQKTNMTERELFKVVFIDNAFSKYHIMQTKPHIAQNPTYEDWLKVKDHFDFYVVEVNPHLLTPQRSSAIITYNLSEYSNLALPTQGTLLFVLLAQTIHNDNYNQIYTRVQDLMSTASSINNDKVVSPPGITLLAGIPDVHPGNKLVTAHQILSRNVKAIVWYPKRQNDRSWLNNCNTTRKIHSLNEIVENYNGNVKGFIHYDLSSVKKEIYRIHLWSDFTDWRTSDAGYAAPPGFDLEAFSEHTKKYPGISIEFNNLHNKRISGNLIFNKDVIRRVFDEWTR